MLVNHSGLVDHTTLVFARAMRRALRAPQWVFVGLGQPVLYLALFGPLLAAVLDTPGIPAGDPWQVFVPGLLVQLALFGTAFAGFDLLFERQAGVLERLRVTPVHRAALLLGRVAKDVVMLLAQSVVLLVAAVVAGLEAPIFGVAAGLVLVLLLGVGFAAISYTVALYVPAPEGLAAVLNGAALPLLLLSGVLLPMSLAPPWLDALSRANPLRWIVEAERAAFRGEVTAPDVFHGLLAALVVAAGATIAGTRAFSRVVS